jgi:hypothetical protein
LLTLETALARSQHGKKLHLAAGVMIDQRRSSSGH